MKEKYRDIPIEYLIVFGIYSLIKKDKECNFEQLIKECFTLFPKIFGFSHYPQWPDSLKFDRPLRKLREKGWVVGNPQTKFFLTKFGEKIARETKNRLFGTKTEEIIIKRTPRGLDAKLLRFLRESESYKQYIKNKKDFVTKDTDLRRLLRCTLETPLRIVKQNLQYYKNLAKEYNDTQLLEFLGCYDKNLKMGG